MTICSLDILLSKFELVHCALSSCNCCFLTCIQISWEYGKMVWEYPISWRIFHSLLWSTVKGFSLFNKGEIDVFLEFSCFFYDPMDVGNLISGSSAFSKPSLNIWKFSVHVVLKPGLLNFEHYFASIWDVCSCVVVWTFFGIAFLWVGMKTDLFQSCGHWWVFQISSHIACRRSFKDSPMQILHIIEEELAKEWFVSQLSVFSSIPNLSYYFAIE